MIEHVVGRTGLRARLAQVVSRTIILPTLSVYPLHGPLVRLYPLVDLLFAPHPRSRAVRRTRIQGSDWVAEQIVPKDGPTADGAILYLHGGAFVVCGLNTHRPIADTLVNETGLPLLSVSYRMHPHGTLSDALDDCLAAWDVLVAQGYDPSQIFVAGDSAGGHLSFALALALRDQRVTPAGIAAFSPLLDMDHTTKTGHENLRRDAMIPAHRLQELVLAILGLDEVEDHHSPVNGELRGLPPVLLMCAEDEVLRIDSELMHDRLEAAGVPVRLEIWSGMLHAFPAVPFPVPEIRKARKVAARFISETLAAASVEETVVA